MNKSSFIWSYIQSIIVQYLSGKIDPHALLAIKNNMKLESKNINGDVNIYTDLKGNRYISTPMGFHPVERYNLSVQIRELNLDYEILLNENNGLEIRLKEKLLVIQRLKEELCVLKEELKSSKANNSSPKVIKITKGNPVNIEKLMKLIENLRSDLVDEKLKNTKLAFSISNNLGGAKKSAIMTILSNSLITPDQKVTRIQHLFK